MAKQGSGVFIFGISAIAAIGGLLFGYDLGMISGALIFLQDAFHLTPQTKGIVVSAATLGCIIGPLCGMWVADHWGRRNALLVAALLLLVSAAGSALSLGTYDFAIWRWIGGIGIGLASIISPMYIAELAPPRLRGPLINVYQLSIVVGLIASSLVAYGLSFGGHWRWMFASEAVPILIWMIGFAALPRSPRWLAVQGNHQESLQVLTRINGPEQAKVELEQIVGSLSKESGSFRELLMPGIRLALLLGTGILVFSQIDGISVVRMYAPTMFVDLGIGTPSSAILKLLFLDIFMLLAALAAFGTVVLFKRRHLLMAGFGAIALAQLLMAGSFSFNFSPRVMAVVMLLAMILIYGAHNMSVGPLGWVINSEIFPNRIRNRAMSVAGVCFWGSNYLCQLGFPVVSKSCKDRWGDESAMFLMFAVVSLIAMILVWRFLPETKDLSLEKIGEFWAKRSSKRDH